MTTVASWRPWSTSETPAPRPWRPGPEPIAGRVPCRIPKLAEKLFAVQARQDRPPTFVTRLIGRSVRIAVK